MKKFKTYFEETEIESLEALIANPDPSRVKMYGGGTEYVDMLKKKFLVDLLTLVQAIKAIIQKQSKMKNLMKDIFIMVQYITRRVRV